MDDNNTGPAWIVRRTLLKYIPENYYTVEFSQREIALVEAFQNLVDNGYKKEDIPWATVRSLVKKMFIPPDVKKKEAFNLFLDKHWDKAMTIVFPDDSVKMAPKEKVLELVAEIAEQNKISEFEELEARYPAYVPTQKDLDETAHIKAGRGTDEEFE